MNAGGCGGLERAHQVRGPIPPRGEWSHHLPAGRAATFEQGGMSTMQEHLARIWEIKPDQPVPFRIKVAEDMWLEVGHLDPGRLLAELSADPEQEPCPRQSPRPRRRASGGASLCG